MHKKSSFSTRHVSTNKVTQQKCPISFADHYTLILPDGQSFLLLTSRFFHRFITKILSVLFYLLNSFLSRRNNIFSLFYKVSTGTVKVIFSYIWMMAKKKSNGKKSWKLNHTNRETKKSDSFRKRNKNTTNCFEFKKRLKLHANKEKKTI